MIFEEKQVRNALLAEGVESFVAAIVADSLNGALGTGLAIVPDPTNGEDAESVQFDGAISVERWPDVYGKLQKVPSRLMEIDESPSPNGKNVEFTIRVSEAKMDNDETRAVVGALRETWNVRIPYTDPEEAEEPVEEDEIELQGRTED